MNPQAPIENESHVRLVAYLLDELETEQRLSVEAELEASAELREEARRLRKTLSLVDQSFASPSQREALSEDALQGLLERAAELVPPIDETAQERQTASSPTWWPAAAAVFALCGGAVLLESWNSKAPETELVVEQLGLEQSDSLFAGLESPPNEEAAFAHAALALRSEEKSFGRLAEDQEELGVQPELQNQLVESLSQLEDEEVAQGAARKSKRLADSIAGLPADPTRVVPAKVAGVISVPIPRVSDLSDYFAVGSVAGATPPKPLDDFGAASSDPSDGVPVPSRAQADGEFFHWSDTSKSRGEVAKAGAAVTDAPETPSLFFPPLTVGGSADSKKGEIVDLLGEVQQQGSSVVYEARDLSSDTPVAVDEVQSPVTFGAFTATERFNKVLSTGLARVQELEPGASQDEWLGALVTPRVEPAVPGQQAQPQLPSSANELSLGFVPSTQTERGVGLRAVSKDEIMAWKAPFIREPVDPSAAVDGRLVSDLQLEVVRRAVEKSGVDLQVQETAAGFRFFRDSSGEELGTWVVSEGFLAVPEVVLDDIGLEFRGLGQPTLGGEVFSDWAYVPPETRMELLERQRGEFDGWLAGRLGLQKPQPGERPRDLFVRFWGDNPFDLASLDPVSTFSADVDTASYTLARKMLTEGYLPTKEQVRTEEFLNYFPADIPAPTESTFNVQTELAPSLFGPQSHSGPNDHWMLRVALRGRELNAAERLPLALTFVVDVSGSMKDNQRLKLVQHALQLLIGQLDGNDSVALVTFSEEATLVLPMTSASNKSVIETAVFDLEPDGGTNAEAGLLMGYDVALAGLTEGAVNRVVLVSDGVANIGEVDQDKLSEAVAEKRAAGIYLNTIGVGMDNHNDVFLEQYADQGDGKCDYIDDPAEARLVFVDRFVGTFQPIARDVKLQVEFDPAQVFRYRLLGYENRAIADQDFRNDAVDAGEVGSGHQVVALYEIVMSRALRAGNENANPLATVRVRHKEPRQGSLVLNTQQYPATEMEVPVRWADASGAYEQTTAGYRRSVLVAQWAEILRRSIHAQGDSLSEFSARAIALRQELNAPEFDEFCALAASSLELLGEQLKLPTRQISPTAGADEISEAEQELQRTEAWSSALEVLQQGTYLQELFGELAEAEELDPQTWGRLKAQRQAVVARMRKLLDEPGSFQLGELSCELELDPELTEYAEARARDEVQVLLRERLEGLTRR